MSLVRALFIPTAAIDAGAIEVLPKCMNDLLKCGIQNIKVYDLHAGMKTDELRQYDVVYLCGGDTAYLLERVNATGFNIALMEYIRTNGMAGNLGLINTRLDVHCPEGEKSGKAEYPLKDTLRLTNTCALVIRDFPEGLEIIGE